MRPLRLALLGMLCAGCAPDLREDFPFDGALPEGTYVTHEDLGNGVTRSTVDSSHKEAWVYFDFDTREEVVAVDAASHKKLLWELAFQRFKIISNGGVSGAGSVAVARLAGVSLGDVTQSPTEGFSADAADGADDNTDVDSTFMLGDSWYSYNLLQHKVLARENTVFVVHTSAGASFAMQLLRYYDSAGSAGRLSFDWKWLP